MTTIKLNVASGTNITKALQKAATEAGPGGTVELPSGTFDYSNVINLNGVTLIGSGPAAGGTVLVAEKPADEALTLTGTGGGVENLEIVGNDSAGRLSVPSGEDIDVNGASGYTISNVYINGGATGGIMQENGANNGVVENSTVDNTEADGITDITGANNNKIIGNLVDQAGNTTQNEDDGISTVSYADSSLPNDGLVYNIQVTGNTVIENPNIPSPGRGISVVGGQNIQITGNYVTGTPMAGIYIAAEPAYDTLGVNGVTASGNTLVGVGGDQGAITFYNGQGSAGASITSVSISDNQIISPGYVAFQFAPGNGPISASVTNNQVYDPTAGGNMNEEFDLSGDPSLTQSGNKLVATSPALLVSPGGGVTTTAGTAVSAATTTAAPVAPSSASGTMATGASSAAVTSAVLDPPGMTFINAASGNQTITLPAAGQGTDDISGFSLTSGDVLNLQTALAGSAWQGNLATLGDFVTTQVVDGNTNLLVDSIGHGAGSVVAVLSGVTTNLPNLLTSHSLVFS